MLKYKKYMMGLSFVLIFTLFGCATDFSENYTFSDPIEMPTPKQNGRGEEIENLVTLYGESYVKDPYLQDIVINARRWNWSEAYNELNIKAKESSEYLDIYRLQAELYLVNSEYQAAVSQLDQILRQHPDDAHALSLAIIADYSLGNVENAKARLEDLNKINSNFADDIQKVFQIIEKWTDREYESKLIKDFEPEVIAVFGEAPRVDYTLTQSTLNKVIKAKELLSEHPEAIILVSGGPVDQPLSEAELMKEWLVDNGVPQEKVVMDELARDTVGNAIGIVDYMMENNLEHVVGVSGYSHLPRGLANIDAYALSNNYVLNIEGVGTGRKQESKSGAVASPYIYYNVFKSYGLIEKEHYKGYVYDNE